MAKDENRTPLDDDQQVLDDEDQSQENKYLLFNLGVEVYGISITRVTDIIELQKITEVPDMPEYVKGVINLRGQIITVIDLRLRFDMEPRTYDDRTCIVIVQMGNRSIGLIVDTVSEVRDIQDKDVDPPPEFSGVGGRDRYISGLGKIGDDVRILLDVDKVVRSEDFAKSAKEISLE